MSGLRALALSYLASAAFFCLAMATAAHSDLAGAFRTGLADLSARADRALWQPLLQTARSTDLAFLDSPDPSAVTIALAPPGPNDARTLAQSQPLKLAPRSVMAAPDDRFTDPAYSASATVAILPDLSAGLAAEAPPVVIPEPPPLAPSPHMKASARAVAVAARLKDTLTPAMLKAFDLFVYVSKADHGPLAQRMYVFRKGQDDRLALLYDWPASTGREQQEISPRGRHSFTGTPRGYYELDPARMYRKYHSRSWDQSMPYAMFFNWERRGLQTGLAIHAASGNDIALLGRRASAGCVHLSPDHARTLYELIRSEYKGAMPRFAYDARTQTMSNDGTLMRGPDGHLKMIPGYKVLVQIENYAGDDSIAALF